MDYRRAYRAAAVSFADLVSRLPADRWDGPGLGDWNLRELVGHTVSAALRQVPPVLATTGATMTLGAPQDYWAFARSAPPELYAAATAASSADARETGKWLGDAAAAEVPFDLPPEVVAEAVMLASRIALAVGDGGLVLRALTGRGPLPEHFSIL